MEALITQPLLLKTGTHLRLSEDEDALCDKVAFQIAKSNEIP